MHVFVCFFCHVWEGRVRDGVLNCIFEIPLQRQRCTPGRGRVDGVTPVIVSVAALSTRGEILEEVASGHRGLD